MLVSNKIDRLLVALLDKIAEEHPDWSGRRVEREGLKQHRKLSKVRKYFSAMSSGKQINITPEIKRALSVSGRRGGLASGGKTSSKKSITSRENGKLGGRPRKKT